VKLNVSDRRRSSRFKERARERASVIAGVGREGGRVKKSRGSVYHREMTAPAREQRLLLRNADWQLTFIVDRRRPSYTR